MSISKKVYAVRRGRATGIFTSWAECKKQVDGFQGARYKGFTDPQEALAWLAGEDSPRTYASSSSFAPRRARLAIPAPSAPAAPPEDSDYLVYTDGSCLRNPAGPGGWACVIHIRATGERKELSGGVPSTTNNRMEMQAAIAALSYPEAPSKITLCTDSQYLKNGLTKWIFSWKKRGWKKADGTEVLNQDLWRELDALVAKHQVAFHWVKGHVGIPENERCDELARGEAMRYM